MMRSLWPLTVAAGAVALLLFWALGCRPRTRNHRNKVPSVSMNAAIPCRRERWPEWERCDCAGSLCGVLPSPLMAVTWLPAEPAMTLCFGT